MKNKGDWKKQFPHNLPPRHITSVLFLRDAWGQPLYERRMTKNVVKGPAPIRKIQRDV